MLWCLVLLVALFGASNADDVVRTFSSENGAGSGRFNHLVVNKVTGQIYVGAVNQLYQLTQDLELVQSELTIHSIDSIENNYNKILIIDYEHNMTLITCGSLNQGTCKVRSPQNISVVVGNQSDPGEIVASYGEASTVAFIAPGPPDLKTNTPQQVMYVGVTFTKELLDRNVPSIASRSLDPDKLFKVAISSDPDDVENTESSISVRSDKQNTYIINYVYGFASEGFSYFLTTQRKTNDDYSPYISKLVRICQNDPNYYSYTEIPITCNSNSGKQYNLVQAGFVGKPGSDLANDLNITDQTDVLFAVFSESEEEGSNRPKNNSGLCIYSFASIRIAFMHTIQACFSGQNLGLDTMKAYVKCSKVDTLINEDFCGLPFNNPIGGEQPIQAVAVLNLSVRATAVVTISTGVYTVVFVGTENGHLKKVVLEKSFSIFEYEDVVIDEGSTVSPDLHLCPNATYLYVMTERRLSKVKIHQCNVHKTFWDCLNRKGTYCGWCSRENKCSSQRNCQNPRNDPLSWIFNKSRLPIISVTPHQLEVTNTSTIIDLEIENMNKIRGQVRCEFTFPNEIHTTQAIVESNGVGCFTPDVNLLPTIPSGQHNFTAKVSVRSNDIPEFVTTKIEFFYCNSYSSCPQCITSGFSCNWCVSQHRCSHSTDDCFNGILIMGESQMTPSGIDLCSTINGTFSTSSNTVVTSKSFTTTNVTVNAIEQTFSSENGVGLSRFNHLVVNKVTGQIYVGAVNQLYQLTQDLEVVQYEVTGPQNVLNNTMQSLTDNYNKVLIIDYTSKRLITCGSILKGTCSLRSLQNISDEVLSNSVPVVTDNGEASTVAFIAPGPPDLKTNTPQQVMYVGVTFTKELLDRNVPSIASRSLDPDRLFKVAISSDGLKKNETSISVTPDKQKDYIINYVYGFASEGFSYFLTTQRKTVNIESPYISKLVRICQNDPNYYSYTEIPITCNSNSGKQYNLVQAGFVGKAGSDLAKDLNITDQTDVLFAVFSESVKGSNRPRSSSALCIYSLTSIRRKFMHNIRSCFSGKGNLGLDFMAQHRNNQCSKGTIVINEDFCGDYLNTPIGGEQPIEAVAVLILSVRTTAVVATSTENYTVVLVGTENGHIEKIVVENSSFALKYKDLKLEKNSIVNLALHLNQKAMHLYVMTERRIYKVTVQECLVYKTCWDCINRKDPYCGWCSMENKCSRRSECHDLSKDPLSWISYKSKLCPNITSVTPSRLQRTTACTLLDLTIENLYNYPGQFSCEFSIASETISTKVIKKNNGVLCVTPPEEYLPLIPAGQHNLTIKLSVRSTDGFDFVTTSLMFYDCNSYSSCTQCVSSEFPCIWCVNQHRCSHSTNDCSNASISMPALSKVGQIFKNSLTFCPTIDGSNSNSREILIASNSEKSVHVKVRIIDHFIADSKFLCLFIIEGRVASVTAHLVGDIIYCNPMEFSYTLRKSSIIVPFHVTWGDRDSKPLDNPHNVHVNIYRCRDLADNCGLCLTLNETYVCGWCQSSHSCEIFEQCDKGLGTWLNRTQTCPDPEIISFYPKLGPWEGGTTVTINGINLGKTFNDIADGVTVAGVKCQPFESLYNHSTQIVCQVDGLGKKENKEGPVVIKIGDFLVRSNDIYQFVDPKVWSINPVRGSQSGGTILHIFGSHMIAGSHREVFIDNLPCRIIYISTEDACCMTSPSDQLRDGKLSIKFDNGTRYLKDSFYEYIEDPTINSVESGDQSDPMKCPKGTPAGGTSIQVVGKNFLSIELPLFYVVYKSKRYFSTCDVLSNDTMICTAPAIMEVIEHLNGTNPEQLEYGFEMDEVATVQNLSGKLNNAYFLYPDPIYNSFNKEIEYYENVRNETLQLYGQHLDNNGRFLEDDTVVRVGIGECTNVTVSKTVLTCKLPKEQPLNSLNDDDDTLPDVMVIVGKKLQFYIGKLSYSSEILFMDIVVYVGTVALTILTIICLVILIAYRQESFENRKNTRVIKKMKKHMDILESRVAKECKEAFAELQTEITGFTGDLTTGGIPFWEYKKYAMKVLFPDSRNYFEFERPDLQLRQKGLRLFGQLIMKKTFLILFIHTLESNRSFSMSDRVTVASLIMMTLQSKMEYCTDILKTLLSGLIVKNTIQEKSNPKLLLRRTESVAEKMLSSWFTFLLHKFVRECAGQQLYLLFLAIKQQVNKGPVDAFTGEARFSLSEEKMIRQVFDFKPMTVHVSINVAQSCTLRTVKVLDCDTISQVKEKALDTFYNTTPFSQRDLKKDDLDLKWQAGHTASLLLNDNDITNEKDGEWKKVNTLNHYKVPDGGRLALVLREHHSPVQRNTPLNQSTIEISPTDADKDSEREWHLVKQNNDNQKEEERCNKMVSEVYLTRLLTTKGILQNYVDDLFKIIFSISSDKSAFPFAIKYIFDFLDSQATCHGIIDPKIVHTWKSNALPLRFWVNLIKNPDFVFDIHKSNIVDSCLSVVAQAFMDSCGTSDHRLGKNSPSSKLLYTKDIPAYKEMVERYYSEIKSMPAISDQDMNAMLAQESQLHISEFSTNCALYELYTYASKYNEQLTMALEEDESARREKLATELQKVRMNMS